MVEVRHDPADPATRGTLIAQNAQMRSLPTMGALLAASALTLAGCAMPSADGSSWEVHARAARAWSSWPRSTEIGRAHV